MVRLMSEPADYAMHPPEFLAEQADRARRLASGVTEAGLRQTLLDCAAECEARALEVLKPKVSTVAHAD